MPYALILQTLRQEEMATKEEKQPHLHSYQVIVVLPLNY